jgi:hypothetical protein
MARAKKTSKKAKPVTTRSPEEVARSVSADELSRRVKDGVLELDDLVEASIIAMFFIQKLGKADLTQIREKIEAQSGRVNEHVLAQAVEALQARGLVAYARGRTKGGDSVTMWKPRQILWAAPPEVAHLTKLLPLLVATPESQRLIEALNTGEKIGEGEEKAKSRLGYDEYVQIEADFVTIDELLGSQPASPWLDEIVKRSPHNGVEAQLRFWRDAADGALLIGADTVRAWLRTGLRTAGYADATAGYLAVDAVRIVPEKPLRQTALPVVDARQGGGKGLNTYEVVQPGQHITVRVRMPSRGFMSAEQFRIWLAGYAANPMRGISPARGARYGKLAMVGYRVIGETRSARAFVGAVMDGIPEEARPYYDEIMAGLAKTDIPLRKGCTKA